MSENTGSKHITSKHNYTREDFDIVIGMEFHAQVSSQTKLFSPAELSFGDPINTHVALVDAGMPGALPVVNQACIDAGIKTALALGMKIATHCTFDRKHYSYPDLPLKYQITQFFNPIGYDGVMHTLGRKVNIERVSLEADAAKNVHDGTKTYVDLNRCGSPLMEIVTSPDMRSPEEAVELYKKIRNLVRTIGTCDANMEKGQMRADVNLSINLKGESFGERVEIKNINSMNFAYQALQYEIDRHISLLNNGEKIRRETRTFDPATKTTSPMREKETDDDYRYMPEPDLTTIEIDPEVIQRLREELPELPDAKIERWIKTYNLPEVDAKILAEDLDMGIFFDECAVIVEKAQGVDTVKGIATWLLGDVLALLNKEGIEIAESKFTVQGISEMVIAITNLTISGKQAKDVLKEMFENGGSANEIIKSKGLSQISDPAELRTMAQQVLDANAQAAEDYKSGNERAFGALVGQAMKISQGRANPEMLTQALKDLLKN